MLQYLYCYFTSILLVVTFIEIENKNSVYFINLHYERNLLGKKKGDLTFIIYTDEDL